MTSGRIYREVFLTNDYSSCWFQIYRRTVYVYIYALNRALRYYVMVTKYQGYVRLFIKHAHYRNEHGFVHCFIEHGGTQIKVHVLH